MDIIAIASELIMNITSALMLVCQLLLLFARFSR
jgi:hypothetical protein